MVKHPGKKHYEYRSAFEKMHMYGIKDKASTLRELQYSAAAAKARIKQDVAWENEGFELPSYYDHIDAIVDYVYSN